MTNLGGCANFNLSLGRVFVSPFDKLRELGLVDILTWFAFHESFRVVAEVRWGVDPTTSFF
jgi:hypothetical protein